MIAFFLHSLLLFINYVKISSYPSKMIVKYKCKKEFTVGKLIMGSPAILSDQYSVVVKRFGVPLSNGSNYENSETLQVSVSDPSTFQYAMETDHGIFSGEYVGCSFKRVYDETMLPGEFNITMPKSGGSNNVKIWFGWAHGNISFLYLMFISVIKCICILFHIGFIDRVRACASFKCISIEK